MKNSLRYVAIIIFLFINFSSSSQTLFSLNFGININDCDNIDPGVNATIVNLSGKSSLNIGFEFNHFIFNKFDIKIGGTYHLGKYSYRFESFGINPFHIYSYKYGNLYLSFGYNIVDWINLGIGYMKIIFYNYEYIWVGGIEKRSNYLNFNMLNFHINFLYKKIIISTHYNKSINSSIENLPFNNFDMLEFKVGYRFQINNGKK